MPEVLTQVDKEDSLKLSGRELDAEIHVRLMGHPPECRLVGDGKSMETALHLEPDNAAWRVRSDADTHWDRWSPTGAERIVIAPHYSSSIEAAMKVVEKLRDQFAFDLETWKTPAFEGWSVKLWANGNISAEDKSVGLPEAICRAALAAIEAKQK